MVSRNCKSNLLAGNRRVELTDDATNRRACRCRSERGLNLKLCTRVFRYEGAARRPRPKGALILSCGLDPDRGYRSASPVYRQTDVGRLPCFRHCPEFAQRQRAVRTADGGERAGRDALLQLRPGRRAHVVGQMVQGQLRVLQVLARHGAGDADVPVLRSQRRRK